MREAGIEVYPFFRVAFPPFATRINWRNHRKLVVIDGSTGYIGGMNIADRYTDGGKGFCGLARHASAHNGGLWWVRCNTALRLTGVSWQRELIEEGGGLC